jgi:hypothetical protein
VVHFKSANPELQLHPPVELQFPPPISPIPHPQANYFVMDCDYDYSKMLLNNKTSKVIYLNQSKGLPVQLEP